MFNGSSHADSINRAIGTSYREWLKSRVDLEQFGVPNVIAWFVFMDGSEHGFDDGLRWENFLSKNGSEILESHVSQSKEMHAKKCSEEGYRPFRLAFQLDPGGSGNRYMCRFAGAFAFDSFVKEDLTAVRYIKISDTFKIGSKGECGSHLGSADDFRKKVSRYCKPITELGFSDNVSRILKSGGITCAGELLELAGIGLGEVAQEIRRKLWECFRYADLDSGDGGIPPGTD